MDYTSRYGLEINPFLRRANDTLVETRQYKEVSSRLNYLHQIKGFGLLTGSPGIGKTTAIRNWISTLNPSSNKVIYIPLSTLTVMEFYRLLAQEFGCEPAFRKVDNFRLIQGAIQRTNIEKKMTPVIVLDEANYLKTTTLNDLKILFNFDMDSSYNALILLAGLPQLNNILQMNAHEPLRQRITMNYAMNPLTVEESISYILEKLKRAKCHQEVFERNALEAIASASNGVPRMLDKITNNSLLIGNSLNESIISSETIMKAVEDIQIA